MDECKVLILGNIPPPIGGVTIHTSRLVDSLKERGYEHFYFLDLRKTPLLSILAALMKFPVAHLHTSHVYFQLLASVICLVMKRKLIITYHGNLGRYHTFKNWVVNLSCRLCYIPVVQNQGSLKIASRLNNRTLLLSSFLPTKAFISPDVVNVVTIVALKQQYAYVFCTNAGNVTFDRSGNETYGILALIHKFAALPMAALIISDPSARYLQYVQKQLTLPGNIIFISTSHNFSDVLTYSDAFIRNTTTDGDSISIHEAIESQVPVFATDCVSRPPECILYHHISEIDLIAALQPKQQDDQKLRLKIRKEEDVAGRLMNLYDHCLST